ncbi:MAG TPA: response regulator [Candidatus Nanoarchaeia archaeon]|nr:response regulator [Candidatus Nanoarchaeia archaeon]
MLIFPAWRSRTKERNSKEEPISFSESRIFSEEKEHILTEDTIQKASFHILHVDDDASILRVSKQILMDTDARFEIDDASSVDEAFSKLACGSYDIIISDFEMPGKNGLQFLKELREARNEIPFIIFTGKGREEIAIKALNLGASGYFNKIGDPETVYGELSYGIVLSVERAKLAQDLKEKLSIIESVTENIGAGLTIIGKDYRIIWANKVLRQFGGERNKLCYSTYNKLSKVCPDCGVKKIFENGATIDSHEYTNTDSNGEVFWIQIIATPIRDEKGNVVSALELTISITERKKAEEQLRKANGLRTPKMA